MTVLIVPFIEKDLARAQGARWNPVTKVWFAPPGCDHEKLRRWLTPPVWTATENLFVDLVPSSAWYSNLRSELTPAEWKAVSTSTYKASRYLCCACGGKGPTHPVECHERWSYDERTRVQTLLRLCSLCPACHEATHIGLANVRGRGREAQQHLMSVNGWTPRETTAHVDAAFEAFERRSAMKWTLDARLLIEMFPLSDETTHTLLKHAAGLAPRILRPLQQQFRPASSPVVAVTVPKPVAADSAKTCVRISNSKRNYEYHADPGTTIFNSPEHAAPTLRTNAVELAGSNVRPLHEITVPLNGLAVVAKKTATRQTPADVERPPMVVIEPLPAASPHKPPTPTTPERAASTAESLIVDRIATLLLSRVRGKLPSGAPMAVAAWIVRQHLGGAELFSLRRASLSSKLVVETLALLLRA